MRLLVIGHSVFDVIEDGLNIRKSPGGIFYTIYALNKIKNKEDEIFLCSCFDDETFHYFESEFGKVNISLLNKIEKISRVNLKHLPGKERIEKYENLNQAIDIAVTDYNIFDGILINMITGFDITLDQLKDIRAKFSGPIFMDVHTFSRGFDENQLRNFRVIPEFENWAKCLDLVQVNQREVFTLFRLDSETDIAAKLLELGVKVLCVTKGNYGAKVYYEEDKEAASLFISAKKLEQALSVGCGDVFGSAFFYNYIRSKDVRLSLQKAIQISELFVAAKF